MNLVVDSSTFFTFGRVLMFRSKLVLTFFSAASFVLLLYPFQATSQVLPFHTYSTKDGLLSNRILTMMQDSRGYLWIGTAEGVSVFDGVTFRNYTPAEGLAGSYVTSVIESKKLPGTMWIGTLDGGLCKFGHGTFKKINLDTPSTQIFSLIEDRNGILWCGTNDFVLQVRNHRREIPARVNSSWSKRSR
jgi:ligand-binding sensor domain-containing protein